MTDGLALAEAVGARCCVDIAGSFSPTSWFGPHPDNLSERFFDAAVENARAIIDAVKPTRTTFCYEMMGWSLPDSPDACLRMLKAVDRKAFAVHLDPCNLVNSPARYYGSSDARPRVLPQARAARRERPRQGPGVGRRDDRALPRGARRPGLARLRRACSTEHARHAPAAPLMLEHLPNEAEYDAARDAVREAGARAGVAFE